MAKLGDVCTVLSGTTPKSSCPDYWNGTINWVTPAELTDDSDTIFESQRKITELAVSDSGLKPFPAGTVLLSSRAPIGKVAIAGQEMYCNQGFKNLVCSDAIYNRYLFHFLKSKTAYLNSLGRGATFKEISKSIVEQIEIPLPPLDEQHHIAAALDKVTDLIAQRRGQLDKLDLLVKSRFVEMFGDIATNSKCWKKDKLQNHIDMITGFPFNSAGYSRNGIKICGGLIIMPNQIKWDDCKFWPTSQGYEQFLLQKDDIVVALDRPWISEGFKIGQIHEEDLPSLLIQRTARIRSKDLDQTFLLYLLKDKAFEIHCSVTGSLVPHISNKDINSYNVIIPPLELQKQFSDFETKNVQLGCKIKHSLKQLETLKKSLVQKYFK